MFVSSKNNESQVIKAETVEQRYVYIYNVLNTLCMVYMPRLNIIYTLGQSKVYLTKSQVNRVALIYSMFSSVKLKSETISILSIASLIERIYTYENSNP